jgi:hypothetical protein
MKLLFISTDGVLANQHYLDLISNRGINYMYNLQNQIDKNKISLINYLVNKTGASVVFSGAWRLNVSLNRLNEMTAKCGATFSAIDTTPYVYKLDKNKMADHVDELEKCLEDYSRKGINVEDYVVLDDRREFRQFNNRLVKVNYDRGLKPMHIERCLDLFGVPRKKMIA